MAGPGTENINLTAAQFARVEALFFEVQQLPPDQQQARLGALCADDARVRAEVESLLLMGTRAPSTAPLHGQFDRSVLEREVADVKALIGTDLGAYRIIDLLGHGGMGMVLLARDTRLERLVAIKTLPPSLKHEPLRLARFLREARILASLSHPNIATVFGLEEHAGVTFLVMEYIDGQTLSSRLGRRRLSIEEALQVCRQIAAGIEKAHEAGVIHRDLKPGNVMFAADGRVKVLDFGLAREIGPAAHDDPTRRMDEADTAAITQDGSVFGTPAYMSPEQVRGKPLDKRSDVFSYGCILYKCLAGEGAFDGRSEADIIAGILEREPAWEKLPRHTPPCIVKLVQRCMAKDPARRVRDMGDVVLELDDALAAREWLTPRTGRPHGRWSWLPWIAVAAALLLTLGVMLWRQSMPTATVAPASPRRFDLMFPDNAQQRDLERVQVAISRDGRTIVVACTAGDNSGLWFRSHGDGLWRRIEQSDGAQAPFLSPDGRWVGFYQGGQLVRRPLVGGQTIRLTDVTNWYGAVWSDDQSIFYSPGWGQHILRLDEPGAASTAATTLDTATAEGSHVFPLVLPGSRWLLYTVWTGGEHAEIHGTDLQSMTEHVIVRNGTTPRFATTPRGDYLLFERGGMIFAAPFDRQRAVVTGPESAIVEGVLMDGTRFHAYYDVADDGTLVYVPGSQFAEESRLAFIDPDGQGTTPFNEDRRSFCEPQFSRDGSKLFVINKGKLYRGYIYDLKQQTVEHLLTGGDTVAGYFSPDGKTIALSIMRDGRYGIYLWSLADGSTVKVLEGEDDYPSFIAWSPDGKWLSYSLSPASGVPRDIWLIEPRPGAQPIPIAATPSVDQCSDFSPDGRWLAYTSEITGRPEVYLTSVPDGLQQRQISFGGGAWPVFAPDGRSLYYRTSEGLMSVEIGEDGRATTRPRVVYDKPFGQSDPLAYDYTVAPDGRILIVEPSERRPSVDHMRIINNWHALLPPR